MKSQSWRGTAIDDTEHISLLQAKLNSYLRFVESGEIYQSYPNAEGRQILIDIVGKYSLNNIEEFFEYTSEVAGK